MKKRLLALAAVCLVAIPAFAATEITAYTDMEPDILASYNKELANKFPDIRIKWVRESGGPITARLLAEKDNPQADIIFGLALSGILTVDQQGGLESYRPAGVEDINPMMRDNRPAPTWVGMNVVVGALAANTRECERLGIPLPASWEGLTGPEYKGRIVMPNPASSGTAYLHITSWLQNYGEEKAWEFMDRLHKNVKMYIHSGSKPAQMAAMGEIPVGVSVDAYIATYTRKRAPIKSVLPMEGVGWDIVASAIVKGTKNLDAVKQLMDYAASSESAKVGLDFDYLPVRAELDDERATEMRSLLLPMDLVKAAHDRETVLNQWRARFGGE